jgi:uncharacterized membrane protein YcjF (UPF0283 family)
MENAFTKVEELAATIKTYINNRIESAKLTVAEKSSAMIAAIMARVIMVMGLFFFLLFAGVALSLMLGNWMGNDWLGFLAVAVTYLLIGAIVWLARGRLIRRPVMSKMIQQLFDEDDQ